MSDVLLSVDHLSKKFCRTLKRSLWYGVQDMVSEIFGFSGDRDELRSREFWSIKDVSFELRRGECLALIGPNGAGKSTLLKMLNGLLKPDRGRVTVRGKVGALIELGAGFNPILTGRENIFINAAVLGFSRKDTEDCFEDILDFAELGDFIDTPVQNYSTGMKIRLGFAVASNLNPDILLVDEVLAVGDMNFQRKCIKHMKKYIENKGSLILVSHNMHLIQSICNRGLLLDHGSVMCLGNVVDAITHYYEFNNQNLAIRESIDRPVGDDAVVVDSVEVSPLEGGGLQTGKPALVRLSYRSNLEEMKVVCGFSIWTLDQAVRITTCTSSVDRNILTLPRGRGVFECMIPQMPFTAGSYVIKAGIYDPDTSWPLARIGWDNTPGYFKVSMPRSAIDARRSTDGDLISMDVKWYE